MVRRGARAVAAAACLVAASSPSRADASGPDKKACVDAATRGQIQRDDGKLRAAVEAFTVCAESSCPAAVRTSCAEWLADARAKIPSITVILADGAEGRLLVDGTPAPLGVPVTVDVGPHEVLVERHGASPVHRAVTLAAGETRTIVVEGPAPGKPAPPAPIERPTPALAWILGGVAIAGVASWATFGLLARSETDRLLDECAPTCTEADRDAAFRLAAVADVSLAIGVVAAISAGVVYLTRPAQPAGAAAFRFAPRGLSLGATFR